MSNTGKYNNTNKDKLTVNSSERHESDRFWVEWNKNSRQSFSCPRLGSLGKSEHSDVWERKWECKPIRERGRVGGKGRRREKGERKRERQQERAAEINNYVSIRMGETRTMTYKLLELECMWIGVWTAQTVWLITKEWKQEESKHCGNGTNQLLSLRKGDNCNWSNLNQIISQFLISHGNI